VTTSRGGGRVPHSSWLRVSPQAFLQTLLRTPLGASLFSSHAPRPPPVCCMWRACTRSPAARVVQDSPKGMAESPWKPVQSVTKGGKEGGFSSSSALQPPIHGPGPSCIFLIRAFHDFFRVQVSSLPCAPQHVADRVPNTNYLHQLAIFSILIPISLLQKI